MNFGPNGSKEDNIEIEIGIVGSRSSIRRTKEFLNRLQYKILGETYPDSNVRSVDFPGLYQNGPLRYYFTVVDDYCEIIPDEIITNILNRNSRNERMIEITEAFHQTLLDLSGIHPKPKLVIISLPKAILKKCRTPMLKEDVIRFHSRSYQDLKQIAALARDEWPLFFDFHHYMKVLGYELNISTQLVKPDTLDFKSKRGNDPASIAWNFCVAAYYKSTGIPWKLADLDPETVHVGISFYFDIGSDDNVVIRAGIAQVYMRTGESQVIRGLEIPVEEDEEDLRRTNLTENQSKELLENAIDLFRRKHNKDPLRLVVHKKSEYTEDERRGFNSAASDIELKDFLHISKTALFRITTPTKYPIMRGSVFQTKLKNKDAFYIYTTGYVPTLATYPGSTVPRPLRVIVDKSDSDIQRLATDIINLTKLDWNTTEFTKRLPVTISVSEKIGDIMGELRGRDLRPPTAYSYYM